MLSWSSTQSRSIWVQTYCVSVLTVCACTHIFTMTKREQNKVDTQQLFQSLVPCSASGFSPDTMSSQYNRTNKWPVTSFVNICSDCREHQSTTLLMYKPRSPNTLCFAQTQWDFLWVLKMYTSICLVQPLWAPSLTLPNSRRRWDVKTPLISTCCCPHSLHQPYCVNYM